MKILKHQRTEVIGRTGATASVWEARLMSAHKAINIVGMALMLILMAVPANAAELKDIVERVATFVKGASVVVGWALGFLFIVAGIMDLMKKDDDPRAGGKGVKKILGGLGLVCAVVLVKVMAEYVDLGGTERPGWE